MPVSDKNQRVSVTLTREMVEQLRELAEAEHRTISSQIAYELSKVLGERTLREREAEAGPEDTAQGQ